ncbi:hypothetical protein [Oricola thermophila]|uniref:Uncharacterized protein n=1 Tax=Oricola thermophila TaxID=2742145 RepID=A0A6N1VHL8_9HYPH|nr:hypothetical protein [Oricola thermophila]QKV20254.1 hypothetical protein HTY61_18245 [Oricola thermophila]
MIYADATEYIALSRAFRRLPGDIKAKAFARAGRRVTQQARTQYLRRASPRLKLTQKVIKDLTTARFNAGGNTSEVIVKSGWIPLAKLSATQTSRGVYVRPRGSYRHAFLATMASGHRGVFMRKGAARLPIRELFGPNPAHDITNNDRVYLEVLAEVIEEKLAPRVLHETEQLLPD